MEIKTHFGIFSKFEGLFDNRSIFLKNFVLSFISSIF